MRAPAGGEWGWLAIASFVVGWNVRAGRCGGEMLSTACGRALDNPRTRPVVATSIVVVAAHLLRLLPTRLDPLALVGWAIRH